MKKASLSSWMSWIAAVVLVTAAAPSHAVSLAIYQHRTDSLLTCIALEQPTFALTFIHSVSLTPVKDIYVIENDTSHSTWQIRQTEERFIAHGQGLPSLVNEPDAIAFEHQNDTFVLKLSRPIPRLIVRTDKRFKNRLHVGQRVINLNQWPDTGLFITPINHCTN